jgi:hypothetical protein
MPTGKSITKYCPKCGAKALRPWVGVELAGEDCRHCGWGEWWVIGKENNRLPASQFANGKEKTK